MKPSKGARAAQILIALLKSACYVGLFLGMQVAVMLPVSIAAGFMMAAGDEAAADGLYNLLMDNTMTFSLVSGVLTIVVILIFYRACGKRYGDALGLRRVPAPTLWEGAALAPALYLVVTFGLSILPEPWLESYSEASAGVGSGTLVGVIAVAVVAPVVEEFVFRGLMMNRLSQVMPGWLAILLSAAIFGICHGHPVWFVYAFVLGVWLGFMDLRAGSILPSILGHVAFNAIGQILAFVPETEEGVEMFIAIGILLVIAIAAPILDRKGIAAMFRPAAKAAPAAAEALPTAPGTYDYDPWNE